jgi:hypothetical protein
MKRYNLTFSRLSKLIAYREVRYLTPPNMYMTVKTDRLEMSMCHFSLVAIL